jgi:hypothetical protein
VGTKQRYKAELRDRGTLSTSILACEQRRAQYPNDQDGSGVSFVNFNVFAGNNSTVILRCSPQGGEPRRMDHKRLRLSFETPRKGAAPQDDGGMRGCVV